MKGPKGKKLVALPEEAITSAPEQLVSDPDAAAAVRPDAVPDHIREHDFDEAGPSKHVRKIEVAISHKRSSSQKHFEMLEFLIETTKEDRAHNNERLSRMEDLLQSLLLA